MIITNSIKLAFYTFFNRVYAYTPNWATSQPSGGNENSSCTSICQNRQGLVIKDGEVCICTPKSDFTNGFQGAQKDTGKLLDTLFEWFILISNIGSMFCIFSLVVGAIQLALSEGQQQKKVKAQNRIKISLIGLAISGGMGIILSFFLSIFKS